MGDFGRHVVIDRPFDGAVAFAREAFAAEGFVTGCTVDLTGAVRAALGRELRSYTLIPFIHPELAYRALRVDLDAGPGLVSEAALYELADGSTVLTVGYPMAAAAGGPDWAREHQELAAVKVDLEARLAAVLARVSVCGREHSTAATARVG